MQYNQKLLFHILYRLVFLHNRLSMRQSIHGYKAYQAKQPHRFPESVELKNGRWLVFFENQHPLNQAAISLIFDRMEY